MSAILTIFWGLVVLVVLVFVHELGHFLAARGFGVRVTEFMIGLPGPSIGFERNGCRYGVTAIPLGGYNRITGMEAGPEDPNLAPVLAHVYRQGRTDVEHTALACGLSEEDAETALVILDGWGSVKAPGRHADPELYAAPGTTAHGFGEPREVADPQALLDAERAQTYRGLSFAKRLVVLFAGPAANVLLAFVLLVALFCGVGTNVASTTLSGVADDGPAAAAGLQEGDTITAVDGTPTPDWDALVQATSTCAVGDEVAISYTRAGRSLDTVVTVAASEQGTPQIGIYAGLERRHMGIGEGLRTSWDFLVTTVQGYASLFNPNTAGETLSQSTSVVGIAVMSRQAAEAGIVPLLYMVGVISLSLGIVNLLPVPPLDGGKIVVEIVQKVLRREISSKVVNAITVVVIALLVVLFVYMTQQDISNFVLGG